MHVLARFAMVLALLCLAAPLVGTDRMSDDPEPQLYVLHLTEEGFQLSPLRLRDGESQTFVIDADSDVVDVIFPVSEGQSGNMVQRSSNRYTVTVRIRVVAHYPDPVGDVTGVARRVFAIHRDPEFGYAFMEEFQDRLYWGTDIAQAGQELPIVDYFGKLRTEKLISGEAYEKITWRNADRLLGLGLGV